MIDASSHPRDSEHDTVEPEGRHPVPEVRGSAFAAAPDSTAPKSAFDASPEPGIDDAAPAPEPHPERTTAGVGPWPGGPAAWPTEPHFDPKLLAHGDTRNVIDRYRYWRMEAIREDLDRHRHPFHVAIENWQHDMNIGSIVRSANAFAADTVHIVGRRRWNKRGAMVTDRYQHVEHRADIAELTAWAAGEGIPIVAIDNVPGCVPMETFDWPERCVMLFGQEGPGLTSAAIGAATAVVEISQYGSTRSINASAAAAIAMFSWVQQHSPLRPGADATGPESGAHRGA